MKKRKILIAATAIAAVIALSLALIKIAMPPEENSKTLPTASDTVEKTALDTKTAQTETQSPQEMSEEEKGAKPPETGAEKDDKEKPAEPQKNTATPKETADETDGGHLTCTLSVSCATILKNKDKLDPEKLEILPNDGVIFAEKTVVFYEGESVFNLLSREMKKNKIHMEFVNTPVYNSAYIEGIANFYEFDCGELSGWMYKVNGIFPNYGCSRYKLKKGDKVEWVYTCDLGADVGGGYSAGTQKDE